MVRKNIFQLVEESYNIQDEIRKINKLFEEEAYFSVGHSNETLYYLIEEYLFSAWEYRGTCIDLEEYLRRVNATLSEKGKIDEVVIVNLLETLENFVKLYKDNADDLNELYNVKYYRELNTRFCVLMETLEKHLGLSKRQYKDRITLYPKNAPLEEVLNSLEDEDVQWELIRYAREEMTLTEKRKSLAYLQLIFILKTIRKKQT